LISDRDKVMRYGQENKFCVSDSGPLPRGTSYPEGY
jgi:hypothetical protein